MSRTLAGPAILFLIVVGFFWKLVLTNQYSWLESPDLANQVLPWFDYEAREFHRHHIPIWDPLLFGGQSLIGQAQPGLAYPFNWILFSLPLDHGHISIKTLNWYYLLIHYFAALFCYLLCRDLGRGIAGSVLAGVAFGLGGYIGNTDWPQMINGAVWGPLVFLFLFRAARGVRPIASAAFSGLFLGMSWLSGHHQIPIYLTLAAGVVWLYFLLAGGRLNRALLAPVAVFAAFFILTGALQMWPAYAYGHTAMRWVGVDDPVRWNQPVPYIVHQQYSLSPIYLLGVLIPGYASNATPFVGIVALTLAGLALLRCWSRREARILAMVGLGGLLLALAKNDVFHGILYAILPMFEKARTPASALYLFHFGIAVLLAYGLDVLLQPAIRPALRRVVMILAGFGALTFTIIFAINLGRALNWNFDDRVMMATLAAFLLAAIVFRLSRSEARGFGFAAMIVGLYLIEIGNVSLYSLPNKEEKDRNVYLRNLAAAKPAADFLRGRQELVRVDVNGDDVPFNFGDWFGIDTINGYAASLPESFTQIEAHTSRVKMLYGVNYALAKKPTMEGQQEVFRGDNGLIVYQNPGAFPRVWTVHEAGRVADPAAARRLLQDPAFDLSKKTFGYGAAPSLEACEGDSIRSFGRNPTSATVVVEMKCRGLVVMSENDAPGWTARVDGKAAPIYDAYTVLRSVVVGQGTHRIEMRYRPLSVTTGAWSTGLGLAGGLVLWLLPVFQRRSGGKPVRTQA